MGAIANKTIDSNGRELNAVFVSPPTPNVLPIIEYFMEIINNESK